MDAGAVKFAALPKVIITPRQDTGDQKADAKTQEKKGSKASVPGSIPEIAFHEEQHHEREPGTTGSAGAHSHDAIMFEDAASVRNALFSG